MKLFCETFLCGKIDFDTLVTEDTTFHFGLPVAESVESTRIRPES